MVVSCAIDFHRTRAVLVGRSPAGVFYHINQRPGSEQNRPFSEIRWLWSKNDHLPLDGEILPKGTLGKQQQQQQTSVGGDRIKCLEFFFYDDALRLDLPILVAVPWSGGLDGVITNAGFSVGFTTLNL